MKKIIKLIFIGTITTLFRVGLQLLLPSSSQSILKDSIFVINGTLPFAFSILAIITYSLISAFALILYNSNQKGKSNQGLKFSLSLCFLWSAYLFEPLPHATSILSDSIAYALVDSLALLIMGLLLDLLLLKNTEKKNRYDNNQIKRTKYPISQIACPTAFFIFGRIILYNFFNIYSYFNEKPVLTMLWCVLTGVVSSCVIFWLNNQVKQNRKLNKVKYLGLLIYAINLILFNSFMLLVFDFSFFDISLRTFNDIITISTGVAISSKWLSKTTTYHT